MAKVALFQAEATFAVMAVWQGRSGRHHRRRLSQLEVG